MAKSKIQAEKSKFFKMVKSKIQAEKSKFFKSTKKGVGLDSEKRLFLRKDAKRCKKRQNDGKRGNS